MTRFVLLALASVTQAAIASSAGPTDGPFGGASIYRLSSASTFQEGCFDPCLCPLMNEAPILGTFALSPQSITGFIDTYTVSQVNWHVMLGQDAIRITGSGTYEIGGEFALMSRLQLDLEVGDEDVAHFDSGWIVGPANLDNVDLTISINGIFCYDTVIQVDAAPVDSRELTPYIVSETSTFQVGCFGFCDCLLGPEQAMRGRFDLLPLGGANGFDVYAAIKYRSHVAPDGTHRYPGHAIRGFGIYQVSQDIPNNMSLQRLMLSLSLDGDPIVEFDSGLGRGGEAFPAINAVVSIDGLVCFDTAITTLSQPNEP
jgi:hypothetical protein